MRKITIWFGVGVFFAFAKAYSQSSSDNNNHEITVSGYVDGYLSGYSTELDNDQFQRYTTVGARDDTFGLNIAQLGMAYRHDKVRANVTFQYGDIPQAIWSDTFNEIQEANVGVKIIDGLWLDAGFFKTHVGTESFLPKENLLSSTSVITFNEPFFQSGASLSYEAISDWNFELWVINSYNGFVDNNDAKSVGALISYQINDRTSITYTNNYGRESADDMSPKQRRFYQNLYMSTNWNDKIFLILGADLGLQSNSDLDDSNDTATLYTALATLRYQFSDAFSITGRGEMYRDSSGFISGTFTNNQGITEGLDLTGLTVGAEYKPTENAYIRGEARYLTAQNGLDIFREDDGLSNERYEVLLTMGVFLDRTFRF
ncbi:Putative beta-barrel porin-2, OmpL-like. bbp2 [Nonlabens sp. Hel1_33_55]|uniref:outer membrane beta-barrel protein n=1 Tax=Nonlabens sp. Hel1_33_55 TaxID=1336802 RepID=UPI000875ED73|nr:outer membrane beta-barrel protein [Nonlabens sp. Hel1_33_55]SCY23719.1 Putative beta-barrel porin-2, OmpL-like. bbp2 [Nonlabens sp. Hel1_33_55]